MKKEIKLAPVSAVIPCYQAVKHLERAVDSVMNQTIRPSELILVDDASPDNGRTRRLIEKLVEKINSEKTGVLVRAIFLSINKGPGGARNAGWEKASKEWIAFLDADDAWHPRKLEVQYEFLRENSCVDACAHNYSFVGNDNDFSSTSNILSKSEARITKVSMGKMLISNRLPTRSVMLKREIPLRFSENSLSEDYSLWLQIIAAGYDVRIMNHMLAFAFKPEYSSGGLSGQLRIQEKGELRALALLYKGGAVNFFTFAIAYGWSVLKFIRRIIIEKYFLRYRKL
jgi:glycosyltransferase involved in cell wall biosynthesis